MKLVSYNIQYGFGIDGRYDLERIARVVADADIIALQEVERFWKRTQRGRPARNPRPAPARSLLGLRPGVRHGCQLSQWRRPHRQPPPAVRNHAPVAAADRLVAAASAADAPHGRPLNTQNAALECLIRTPCGPIRFLSLHLAHIGAERAAGADRLSCSTAIAARRSKAGRGAAIDDETAPRLDEWRGRAGKPAGRDLDGRFQLASPAAPNTSASPATTPIIPGRLFRRLRRRGGRCRQRARLDLHTHVKEIDGESCGSAGSITASSAPMLASRVRSVRVDNAGNRLRPPSALRRHRPRNAGRREAARRERA